MIFAVLGLPLNGWDQLNASAGSCSVQGGSTRFVQHLFGFVFLTTALILVVYFYVRIFRLVRVHQNHQMVNREMQLAKQMFVLVCFFCVVWIPMDVGFGITVVNPQQTGTTFQTITSTLLAFHAVVDPALYVYFNRRIRNQLWTVLSCGQQISQGDVHELSLTGITHNEGMKQDQSQVVSIQ